MPPYIQGKLFLKFIENVKNESIYLIEFNSQVTETLVPMREIVRAGTEKTAAAGEKTEKATAKAQKGGKDSPAKPQKLHQSAGYQNHPCRIS